MSDKQPRCGTCKHWQQGPWVQGTCEYPVPLWLSKAAAAMRGTKHPFDHHDKGNQCPVWNKRDE